MFKGVSLLTVFVQKNPNTWTLASVWSLPDWLCNNKPWNQVSIHMDNIRIDVVKLVCWWLQDMWYRCKSHKLTVAEQLPSLWCRTHEGLEKHCGSSHQHYFLSHEGTLLFCFFVCLFCHFYYSLTWTLQWSGFYCWLQVHFCLYHHQQRIIIFLPPSLSSTVPMFSSCALSLALGLSKPQLSLSSSSSLSLLFSSLFGIMKSLLKITAATRSIGGQPIQFSHDPKLCPHLHWVHLHLYCHHHLRSCLHVTLTWQWLLCLKLFMVFTYASTILFFFFFFFLRSPAISLGFTTYGWDFCVCDRFLIQPLR